MHIEASAEAMVRPSVVNFAGARAPASRPVARGSIAQHDCVEFSTEARAMSRERAAGLRSELIEHVRQEIAEGRYITPERLDAAAERLTHALLST